MQHHTKEETWTEKDVGSEAEAVCVQPCGLEIPKTAAVQQAWEQSPSSEQVTGCSETLTQEDENQRLSNVIELSTEIIQLMETLGLERQ